MSIAVSRTPIDLRAARTCYDHMAGRIAVLLHDRFEELGWLAAGSAAAGHYQLTKNGTEAVTTLGIDVAEMLVMRRSWVKTDPESRRLHVTSVGRRELHSRFGLKSEQSEAAVILRKQ
jgi:hypothetical protein